MKHGTYVVNFKKNRSTETPQLTLYVTDNDTSVGCVDTPALDLLILCSKTKLWQILRINFCHMISKEKWWNNS